MRGFQFDDYNTADDWELILTSKTIDPPEPKTYTVDLDGRDGSLDLSESLAGEIKFKDRTITSVYLMSEGSYEERQAEMRKILNYIQGKKRKIIEPDDPDHYFYGRSKVTGISHNKAYSTFTITSTCEPWRYLRETISRYIKLSSTDPLTFVFTNDGARTACPKITVTGIVYVKIGDDDPITLTAGSYRLTGLKLYSGSNEVVLYGSGTALFEYEEADL